MILPAYGLMGAALSTYHDYTGSDNFYLHGAGVGLAVFPFCFAGYSWWALGIQTVICAVAMGILSQIFDQDFIEEGGRGFFSTVIRVIHF